MTPSHVIVTDEGFLTWQANPANLQGIPVMALDVGMLREARIRVLLTTNTVGLHPTIRANLDTQLTLNLTAASETNEIARTFGLSPAQREYLERSLNQGEAIALFAQGWRYPVRLQIPAHPGSKSVSPAEWEQARQRINQLLPPATTAAPVASAAEPTSRKNPVAADALTPSEPSSAANRTTPPIALNAPEEALLRIACARLHPATQAYRLAELHPQTGDRAKDKLITLGLLTQEKIVVRSGRGGTAIVLRPTARGFERAGVTPTRRTRGGDSVQHQYFVQELAASLAKATVECVVGTKSVDVLLAYNTEDHQLLRTYLSNQDGAERLIALNGGDLLAIEVEVSDPAKTSLANVTKNHEAGIRATLVATMPKLVEQTRKTLAAKLELHLRSQIGVLDALALLDALRSDGSGGRE